MVKIDIDSLVAKAIKPTPQPANEPTTELTLRSEFTPTEVDLVEQVRRNIKIERTHKAIRTDYNAPLFAGKTLYVPYIDQDIWAERLMAGYCKVHEISMLIFVPTEEFFKMQRIRFRRELYNQTNGKGVQPLTKDDITPMVYPGSEIN